MGLSCTASEIERFQSKIFPTSSVFNAAAEGVSPWNWVSAQGVKKLELWGYQMVKKVLR